MEYIHDTIYDPTIDIREDFRNFLKHPMYFERVLLDKQQSYWLKFSWLVIFSIFQNTRIGELEELWYIPDEDKLDRKFEHPYDITSYCDGGIPGEVITINSTDDGIIDVNIDFSIHRHITRVPEWASVVCWLPYRPKNYLDFEGCLRYEIRAMEGINRITVELQNIGNEGGHKYFAPIGLSNNWEVYTNEFSRKTVPANILQSFGAICFVMHPDDFTGTDYKAHLQLRNIRIEL